MRSETLNAILYVMPCVHETSPSSDKLYLRQNLTVAALNTISSLASAVEIIREHGSSSVRLRTRRIHAHTSCPLAYSEHVIAQEHNLHLFT